MNNEALTSFEDQFIVIENLPISNFSMSSPNRSATEKIKSLPALRILTLGGRELEVCNIRLHLLVE